MKTAIAICVLASGIGLAMLFRKAPDAESRNGATSQSEVTFRAGAAKTEDNSPPAAHPANAPSSAAEPSGQRLVPLKPVIPAESDLPPRLSPSFPPYVRAHEASHSGQPAADRTTPGAPQREAVGEQPKEERTHKIADGDTLRSVATRYLDDGDRYLEVFHANRAVLTSPDLLPIGGELKIPPKRPQARPVDPRPSPPAPSASTISNRSSSTSSNGPPSVVQPSDPPEVVEPKMVPVRSRR
ncbi:MAG: hypothetical protein WDZ59_15930 [Pirellulales bacterium]